MSRYTKIQSATFDGLSLPLPVGVTIARRCRELPADGDVDAFTPSIQTISLPAEVELTVRDIPVTESLSIGRRGSLVLLLAPGDAASPDRSVILDGAVLVRAETRYTQNKPAVAVLRFLTESDDGLTDPFRAEDAS